MKYILIIGMLGLMMIGTVAQAGSPTIRFDSSLLQVNSSDGIIIYDTCRAIPVGTGMSLSAITYFVEIPFAAGQPEIAYKVIERQLVASVDAQKAFQDIVTSDDPATEAVALDSRKSETLGREPVCLMDRPTVGDKRFVRIVIFPVTIDDDGNCYINSSLAITVDGKPLAPPDLHPESALDPLATEVVFDGPTLLAAAPVEYLIVTSDSLLEAVARLVAYKNSTGIKTAVEVVSDIINSYDGRDDAERLRERLKDFYAGGGQYVLLAGDETMLPLRYAYPYSTTEPLPINSLQICDFYFADLTGEWDVDNDGVWGERYIDDPDLTPELIVGRLPFNSPEEVANYVDKLIVYETNPGNGQRDYLTRAFFFSSDQMRDYSSGGQHHSIATAYPEHFLIDTANGVELASGDDPEPYNQAACLLEGLISDGFGIVNVIAHGANDAFGVRTTRYNEWPKSYFMSRPASGSHGDLTSIEPNQRMSIYYSLACSNGGFDNDQPPYDLTTPNMVQTMLGLKDAGAVAFVANSRWGWVSSSYLIQQAFFESLFQHPERVAPRALYDAKNKYSYYTDQVYGLNYHGDPTLKVYTVVPEILSISTSVQGGNLIATVSSTAGTVDGCELILSLDGEIVSQVFTGNDGRVVVTHDIEYNQEYTLAAKKAGHAIGYISFTASAETAVDEGEGLIPQSFELSQNYPNPFNPSTTIRLELPRRLHVTLTVYNSLGQVVTVLKDETLPAGLHCVEWDGADKSGDPVASGVYFYRVGAGDFSAVKKMVLLR